MKLIVDEKTTTIFDKKTFVNNFSFDYKDNETGGQLYNGTLFVSKLSEDNKEAQIHFLKQVEEDKFEVYKEENVKLNEAVEVIENMSEARVIMRFALIN
ncbi:MAG: hypothetical protein IJB10_03530 [Clostridia bacterium]|nr:hypothetical protein [Clostridia bacterium]